MAKKASSKTQWRINHLIGVLLVLVIFCAIQFVSYKEFYRKNLTSSDYLRLSEMTVNMLQNLPDEVKITTFISPQADELGGLVFGDVQELLQQYRYTSKEKVVLAKVDPFIDVPQAQALMKDFKLKSNENVVVLQYQDKSKVIKLSDMAELDNSGRGPIKLAAFKGEQEITSGIQSLILGKKAKIYFLTGHGEYDPKADPSVRVGYTLLASYIERQNAEVIKLNLVEKQGVPEDADLLVIGGPQQKLSELEINMLKAYLKKTEGPAPRLILMLDPDTVTGLENFLEPYGVTFDNDWAVMLYNGSAYPNAVTTVFANHPIMAWARAMDIQLIFGRARSLSVKMVPGESAVKLAQTPASYWGETDLKNQDAVFDVAKDLTGPLTIAAVIDSGTVPGAEINVTGPQIVAVGSANFLINQLQDAPQLDFFLNCMNWMLGKRDSLGISPKRPEEFRIALTDQNKTLLTQINFMAIPLVIVVIGLLVWLRRRK